MGGGGTEGFAHTTTVAQDSEGYREKKTKKERKKEKENLFVIAIYWL